MDLYENCEKFYGKIVTIGEVHRITIPIEIIRGLGLKEGDTLKVWIRPNNPEPTTENNTG
jgi:bifunctional DNA-binding transcriptional regulator/antitoxin component of YhaV-PrlF toxin-antitoxin module